MPLDPEHRPRQPAEHFNPATHITARDLRKNKMSIPENIPDNAWISKQAVRPRTAERDGLHYLTADFLEPFRVEDDAPEGDWDPITGSKPAAARAAQGGIVLGPKGERILRNRP